MTESGLFVSKVSEVWPILMATVFLIIWLIRLEAKVLYLDKQNDHRIDNDNKIWERFESLQGTLTTILQSLARLEGKIEAQRDDM